MVETPTFTLRSQDLRDMDNDKVIAEAVARGRRIQALEKKVEALKRDLLKQRAIARRLVGTLGEVCQSERLAQKIECQKFVAPTSTIFKRSADF
jgi:hypothetical protein